MGGMDELDGHDMGRWLDGWGEWVDGVDGLDGMGGRDEWMHGMDG